MEDLEVHAIRHWPPGPAGEDSAIGTFGDVTIEMTPQQADEFGMDRHAPHVAAGSVFERSALARTA